VERPGRPQRDGRGQGHQRPGGVTGLLDLVDERLPGNPGRNHDAVALSSRFTRAITLLIVLSLFPIQAAQAAQVKEATFP
jgi:hypothetical protein